MSLYKFTKGATPLLTRSIKIIRDARYFSGRSPLTPSLTMNKPWKKIVMTSSRCLSDEIKDDLTVDFDYVKMATKNEDTLIIDVREPEEIQELGQIPNSINIPLGSIVAVLSTVSDKEFKEIFDRRKPSENTEIIFYCMIGKRSGKAQKDAISLGFKNAKNYLGSWTDWASKTK